MRYIATFGFLVVVLVTAPTAQGQSPHPIIGTWELDPGRSTFDPGPGPQSAVHSYVERDDGFIVFTRSAVNADGSPGFVQVAFKFDGRDYTVYTQGSLAEFLTTGTRPATTVMYKDTGGTVEQTSPGAVTRTLNVSPDGQTLRQTVTGTNAQGPVNNMLLFERVE